MTPKQIKKLIGQTKGRENKNLKYAFWLGYELGSNPDFKSAEKETMLRKFLRKVEKISD